MDRQSLHKKLISTLRGAMYDFRDSEVRKQLDKLFNQESVVRLCYPLGEIIGADKFYIDVYEITNALYNKFIKIYPIVSVSKNKIQISESLIVYE